MITSTLDDVVSVDVDDVDVMELVVDELLELDELLKLEVVEDEELLELDEELLVLVEDEVLSELLGVSDGVLPSLHAVSVKIIAEARTALKIFLLIFISLFSFLK
ncbi:MAG: hypothetical protein ACI4JT_09695 [Oscillospiraceae bacterium]